MVFSIGAQVTPATYYRFVGTTCTALTGSPYLGEKTFVQNAEIPPAEFAELTVTEQVE